MSIKIKLLTCTGLIAGLTFPALAQPAASPETVVEQPAASRDEDRGDVIIVTARKRDELLEEVPAAITAFGQDEIARYNLNGVDDLTRMTPGLQAAESSVSSGGSISLRGVGSGASNYLGDQAVSINVDGMQVGTLNIRKSAQIDMAQIEILRGPQALFFGKNSPGGVISFKTADPTGEQFTEVSGGYETVSKDAYIQGIYSAPINDQVGVRLVGRYSDLGGYFRVKSVPANGDPRVIPAPVDTWPSGEEWFFRGTIIAEPIDVLRINAKLTYSHSNIEGGSITPQQRISCPNGAPQLQPDFSCRAGRDIYLGSAPPGLSVLVPGSESDNGFGFREYEQILGTVQVDYNLTPDLTATSVTGYYWFDEMNSHNASVGPRANLIVPYLPYQMKQFTQELRLASDWDFPVNFTTGVFYEKREAGGAQDAVILTGPSPIVIGTERTDQNQSAYSAFGQLIWDVTDTFELSGGLRYSHEEKDLKFYYRNVDITGNLVRDDLSFNNLSPEITASWHVTDDMMLFGSYKQGFKSGGFDAGFTNGAAGRAAPGTFSNTFNEEHVSGYEAGLKGAVDDFRFTLTGYSYDYEDLQVGAFDAQSISFKVLNAAAAKVQGIELETLWDTPIDGLRLHGSVAYNDAKFEDFMSACYLGQTPVLGCNQTLNTTTGAYLEQDMSGKQLNNAPEIVAFGGMLYTWTLDNGLGLEFNFDAEYSDSYYANLRQSPQDIQDSYTKLNAGIRLIDADDRWDVSLLGRNLTDEYTFMASGPVTLTGSGSGTPTARLGDQSAAMSRGREIFIRAAYRF